MVKTISAASKETHKRNPNSFNTAKREEKHAKEIDRDESHSCKQQIFFIIPIWFTRNSIITMKTP
jgi:hypothetical protein